MAEPLPDLLDRLGLPILEVGAVQVASEAARLYWPSGEVRVTLLLQAAWSGALEAHLEVLAEGAPPISRSVKLSEGEVRRVRIPLLLRDGTRPILVKVRAPIPPDASRVRAAWIKDSVAPPPKESESTAGAFFGALKQAVGMREKKVQSRAPDTGSLAVTLSALGAPAPLATEEDTVWSPGMPLPEEGFLHVNDGLPEARRESRVAQGARPECPHCYAWAYAEVVRELQRCPSCGHDWHI